MNNRPLTFLDTVTTNMTLNCSGIPSTQYITLWEVAYCEDKLYMWGSSGTWCGKGIGIVRHSYTHFDESLLKDFAMIFSLFIFLLLFSKFEINDKKFHRNIKLQHFNCFFKV